MEKILVSGDCWLWQGSKSKRGYGFFTEKGVSVQAHRWAYLHFVGEIPRGMYVLHRVGCTSRACVNHEKHLYLGTQKQNMLDREDAGTHVRGEASRRAKVSEAAVRTMHALRRIGLTNDGVAAAYGLHPSHVSRILSGKRWAHVKADVLAPPRRFR